VKSRRSSGGRPRVLGDIQELARQKSPEAIETLTDIMQNAKAPPAARVAAANSLLDRGYGRPLQVSQSLRVTVRAEDLSDDELATIALSGDALTVEPDPNPRALLKPGDVSH
jgi:hypothetical protein